MKFILFSIPGSVVTAAALLCLPLKSVMYH